jgi:hypothetical protein
MSPEGLSAGIEKPISKREGIFSDRAIAMKSEWKSVQLPRLASQAQMASPFPQPVPDLS